MHVVRRGETLSAIARLYGTSVSALMRANRLLNPNLIRIGQRLIIPAGPAPDPRIYRVAAGDTVWRIAMRFGTTPAALINWPSAPKHGKMVSCCQTLAR